MIPSINSPLLASGPVSENKTLVSPPWRHTLGLDRVKQPHLDLYSGYRKKFLSPQGVAAKKLIFNDRKGKGDDNEVTVYGVNAGTQEIFYNKSMVSLGFFGQAKGERGVLTEPFGIAADVSGNVFIADRASNRIVHLVNRHNELSYSTSFTVTKKAVGGFSPVDIDLEGNVLYITDEGNNTIKKSDLAGNLIEEFGGGGQIERPFGVAAISEEKWNYYGSEFVCVTDSLNQRLCKYTLDGELIECRRFREISDTDGGFFFVAIDFYSNVYVTDRQNGCIYKFDRYLRYLTRVGCGSGTGKDLDQPRGIAIDRRFGQIFVAEREGASYFWVGTDILNLRGRMFLEAPAIRFVVSFLLTEQSMVNIRLEMEDGQTARLLAKKQFMEPGNLTKTYRFQESQLPKAIANCKYRVVVDARPTYSSNKYHKAEKIVPVRQP